MTSAQPLWFEVNRRLVAKALSELSFEEILAPAAVSSNIGRLQDYRLQLQSGVSYLFRGWTSLWGQLRIDAGGLLRDSQGDAQPVESAAQFFIDARTELGMSEIVLGNFLEEMHSTLFSDMRLLEKTAHLTVDELSTWCGLRLQTVLNGHPKIVLNKGRMGWGASDLELYAPESEEAFQLFWVAVEKTQVLAGFADGIESDLLAKTALAEPAFIEATKTLRQLGREFDDHILVPVHPWQWDRIIRIQFAGEIASGRIVPLGTMGDRYLPQISLRTLSNVSRPGLPDIKLPLSILNTSAIRGISPRSIASAPLISDTLARLCETDPLLKEAGTRVLREIAGVSLRHPHYSQVKGAPYRYQEYFGAIWRECAEAALGTNEQAVLTGALFHQDHQGRSLIGAWIRRSGLRASDWLRRYFDVVIVPLYHLQVRYGIGLVAHGQNVVLKLKDSIPCGVFLKDFQGDLRVSERALTCGVPDVAALTEHLDRLPVSYLIHDLVTGHFLTVLRFVSATLEECEGFHERDFYAILRESLEDYLKRQQSLPSGPLPSELDLMGETFHRVLLNKVRFKIGYADSSERPLPMLGRDLINPLYKGGSNVSL